MNTKEKIKQEQKSFVETIKSSKKELSDSEIVKIFIKTENEALEYLFQGKFFPSYHHKIKKIFASAMRDIDKKDKIDFFFHILRLDNLYPSLKKSNYTAFKSAFAKIVPLINDTNYSYLRCSFDRQKAQILFNIKNTNSSNIFDDISYEDFSSLVQFYTKCKSYWDAKNILKKSKLFENFYQKEKLVKMLSRNVVPVLKQDSFSKDNLLYGTLMIIVLSNEFFENNTLVNIHNENLQEESVNFLKNHFYNCFDNNKYAKKHLSHLNTTIHL